MIIRTAKKQNRYSTVDNTGFNDPRLSYKAKGLLAYFLTKPDNWEVHIEDVRKHGTDGKDSIQAGMRELSNCGYAKLESVRGDGGRVVGKQWVIHEVPLSPIAGKSRSRLSPTAGKTVCRENRLTGKPSDGKPGCIVSTDLRANTDVEVNTDVDVVRTATDSQKQLDFENQKNKNTPPIPPRPPMVLFSESQFASDVTGFCTEIQARFPNVPSSADFYYYHSRCLDWSANKPAMSNDWPRIAAKFILDDHRKGDLHTSIPKSTSHVNSSQRTGPATTSNHQSIIERSIGIAERLGYKVG